jgi:hypothetical protein
MFVGSTVFVISSPAIATSKMPLFSPVSFELLESGGFTLSFNLLESGSFVLSVLGILHFCFIAHAHLESEHKINWSLHLPLAILGVSALSATIAYSLLFRWGLLN